MKRTTTLLVLKCDDLGGIGLCMFDYKQTKGAGERGEKGESGSEHKQTEMHRVKQRELLRCA